jgi:5-(carboxyamino)imidazole ribonucleotide synthase
VSNNYNKPILPPATIGIVGGGQLGQMMALAAKSMGYRVGVLDPTPNCPTAQVCDFQITAAYTDQVALKQLATASDVLTYEFENVDVASLKAVEPLTTLPQGTDLLTITGQRLNEKNFLKTHHVPVTQFAAVATAADLPAALEQVGYPSILKTVVGGYDGHGQQDLNSPADLVAGQALIQQAGTCILEQRQAFTKELSVMVTRSADGQVQTFPVAENQHHHHILHQSIIPARVSSEIQHEAQRLATVIAQALKLRGVLGIEMFLKADGQLLVNELAPRPHNSGHYSIEACNISQFAAHIRSICGLAIPPIQLQQPAVMVNLLGQHLTAARQRLPQRPQWYFHDYGKAELRQDRKMGHITMVGSDQAALIQSFVSEGIWEAEEGK